MFYTAGYEYQTEDQRGCGTATSTAVLYASDNPVMAVRDALRWWDNRHAAIPEHFARMLALKVRTCVPQRVDNTGYLPVDSGQPFYEWKCDYPFDPLQQLKALQNNFPV